MPSSATPPSLSELSAKASPGPWKHDTGPSLNGSYHTIESPETMVAEAYCALEMHDGTQIENDEQHAADAEFVTALVNAYRAGDLTLRSEIAEKEVPCRLNEAVGLLMGACELMRGSHASTMFEDQCGHLADQIDTFIGSIHPLECGPLAVCSPRSATADKTPWILTGKELPDHGNPVIVYQGDASHTKRVAYYDTIGATGWHWCDISYARQCAPEAWMPIPEFK